MKLIIGKRKLESQSQKSEVENQKSESRNRKSKIENRKSKAIWQIISAFCLLSSVFCFSSCRVPNLEKPECTEASKTVKEFYSYHFGNDMKPSKENLQTREKFLTGELKNNLNAQSETAKDYFTATDDYPKAFRIGSCEIVTADKAAFQIVLFWRDDTRSEQREVKVEVVKQTDKWLIDKVSN